jgi:hypothetical protein
MMWNVDLVKAEVVQLLLDSGFAEELFYVKEDIISVIVMFDCKEAVDYFKVDFEYSELAEKYNFRYKIDGKRHCAVIY